MAYTSVRSRSFPCLLAAGLASVAGNAGALEFMIADNPLRVENLFTVGGMWRAQDVDPTLIGKSTLYARNNPGQGLCLERFGVYDPYVNPNTFTTLQAGRPNRYQEGEIARGCTTSAPTGNQPTVRSEDNAEFVAAPGSFSPNGDNGNLNFEKGDLVAAVAKITTDVNYSIFDYNFFVRGVAFFDYNYDRLQETHYDTTGQARYSDLPEGVERTIAIDYDLLDYNIGHVFDIGGRSVSVKVGDQVLNWGESSLLALNSLNTINPPDARRLNTPGLDLKEAFRPIGMLTASTDVWENITVDAFYGYEWKPIVIDPVGTFFSQSDTLGPGGEHAILSFAKPFEDPGFVITNPTDRELASYPTGRRGYYRPIDTCAPAPANAPCADSIGLLGSTASRTIYRDHAEEKRREPNGGDYGAVLKFFLEELNNGTELALYHANYDSRLPSASFIAAQDSCIGDNGAAAALTFAADCGYNGPGVAATGDTDPIPVDTARIVIEYPEDIRLWGLSFNTTVGDFALSGEYAFRENLPIQIDTADLTFAAEQPAFPEQDVPLGAVTIPGRQSAFGTFVTRYRGLDCAPNGAAADTNCIQAGEFIPGYERFKVGQLNLTVLRLIGGDNPIGASQMTLLMEMGMQKVFDMPALSELQLEGSGSDTHISSGADGSQGIDPPLVAGNARQVGLIQNPTAHRDYYGYGTSESYGYRILNLNRWESALFGSINLETLAIIRHDVKGTTPGIATNFTDGRKQFNFGIRGDYLSTYIAEVRYTWFTGGGRRDGQRDRDNVFVTFGYQF